VKITVSRLHDAAFERARWLAWHYGLNATAIW